MGEQLMTISLNGSDLTVTPFNHRLVLNHRFA
jgi:hypothetical protein